LIAFVNHKGDSDSTGAVEGIILGASLGLEEIPEESTARPMGVGRFFQVDAEMYSYEGMRIRL